MTVEQLRKLADAAYMLHYYTDAITNTFEPGYNVPVDYADMQEYREHLACLCGHYRMEIGRLYNNVDGWQDI